MWSDFNILRIEYTPGNDREEPIKLEIGAGYEKLEDYIIAFRAFLFAKTFNQDQIDDWIVNPYGSNYMVKEGDDEE